MDEFEQRSREIARAILEQHGWKRPMAAELKEMREVVGLPYTECKRYLVEEWQNMRVPLLEKENARLRELQAEIEELRRAAHDLLLAALLLCDPTPCEECKCLSPSNKTCALAQIIGRLEELGVKI